MPAPTTSPPFAAHRGANAHAALRIRAYRQPRPDAVPGPELYNIDFAQVDAAAKAVAENADIVLGVKVRMSENVIAKHGTEPLRRAILACEKAGGGKVMCHIGGVETPKLMSDVLDLLRPGDVLTHAYSGARTAAPSPTSCRTASSCPRRWPPSSAAWCSTSATAAAASTTRSPRRRWRRRGPDTISSDIHVFSGNSPGMPYLTWVMSKFLNLGLTLEQVVAMATVNPAKTINRAPKLGTLQVGPPETCPCSR